MQNKKHDQTKSERKNANIILAVVSIVILAIATFFMLQSKDNGVAASTKTTGASASIITEKGDLVIPLSTIGNNATFYDYNELNTKMEVIAVEASDGTVRTAFNTCQVCYSSGRGYYVQEGKFLVCQNCGNRFNMDAIGKASGGCNPVPILDNQKLVIDESITITKDFLTQAEGIFANWKL